MRQKRIIKVQCNRTCVLVRPSKKIIEAIKAGIMIYSLLSNPTTANRIPLPECCEKTIIPSRLLDIASTHDLSSWELQCSCFLPCVAVSQASDHSQQSSTHRLYFLFAVVAYDWVKVTHGFNYFQMCGTFSYHMRWSFDTLCSRSTLWRRSTYRAPPPVHGVQIMPRSQQKLHYF